MAHVNALPLEFINSRISTSDFETLLIGSTVNIIGFNYNAAGNPLVGWSPSNNTSVSRHTQYLTYVTNNQSSHGSYDAYPKGCSWASTAGDNEEWVIEYMSTINRWLIHPAQHLSENASGWSDGHNIMIIENVQNRDQWFVQWDIKHQGWTIWNGILYANMSMSVGNTKYMYNAFTNDAYSNYNLVPTSNSIIGTCTIRIVTPGARLMQMYCDVPNINKPQCIGWCANNNCFDVLNQYCNHTDGAIFDDACVQWCSSKSVNCDAAMVSGCEQRRQIGLSDIDSYNKVCRCYESDLTMETFAADLNRQTGVIIDGDIRHCYYTPCTVSIIKQYYWKNGDKVCPSKVNCINNIDIDDEGAIRAVSIETTEECSAMVPAKTDNGGGSTGNTSSTNNPPTTSVPPKKKNTLENNKTIIVVGIACGVGALLLGFVAVKVMFNKKKRR